MAKDNDPRKLNPLERDAEDKVDTVREIFSPDPKPPAAPTGPPPGPVSPPPAPEKSPQELREELEAKRGCADVLKTRGTLLSVLILVGLILGGVGIYLGTQDDEKCSGSRPRRDGLQLIACVPSSSDSASSGAASSDSASSSSDSGGTPPVAGRPDPNVVTTSPDGTAFGGPASDSTFATPQSAPAGSMLFKGASGDEVGFIAQDGQFRYLSLERPGIGVGEAARPDREIVWNAGDGIITEFGVRTSGGNTSGRYGFNPYSNPNIYLHGCALELGQTACKVSTPSPKVIHNGDRVVIQVGEAGHLDETGDFTFEWWFVFQPS